MAMVNAEANGRLTWCMVSKRTALLHMHNRRMNSSHNDSWQTVTDI